MDVETWLRQNIKALNAALDRRMAVVDAQLFVADVREQHRLTHSKK